MFCGLMTVSVTVTHSLSLDASIITPSPRFQELYSRNLPYFSWQAIRLRKELQFWAFRPSPIAPLLFSLSIVLSSLFRNKI